MNEPGGVEQVGEQDPELQNSPIVDESEDDVEYDLHEQLAEHSFCFFNNQRFPNGAYVSSGTIRLRCDRGVWVVSGSSDPDNP